MKNFGVVEYKNKTEIVIDLCEEKAEYLRSDKLKKFFFLFFELNFFYIIEQASISSECERYELLRRHPATTDSVKITTIIQIYLSVIKFGLRTENKYRK
jgi:hypothetical protein